MAEIHKTEGYYARFCGIDKTPVNLPRKVFVLEIHKSEALRDNPERFIKPEYKKCTFDAVWELEYTGNTTLNEITSECYRCLKLDPEYKDNWESDEV